MTTREEIERLVRVFERIQGYKGDEHRRMAEAAILAMRETEEGK